MADVARRARLVGTVRFQLFPDRLRCFAICFCTLFLISVLDRSVNNGAELKSALNAKIIGELGYIRPDNNDIAKLWTAQYSDSEYVTFKNQLRALRLELDNKFFRDNHKVFGITGFGPASAQAFTVLNLAYAFGQMNKKVLLIGNHELTSVLQTLNMPVDQSIRAVLQGANVAHSEPFSFVKNDLDGQSLLEIKDRKTLSEIFGAIRDRFDLIIVALDPLNDGAENREWMSLIELYTAVFIAGSTLLDKEKVVLASLNEDEKFAGWIVSGVK